MNTYKGLIIYANDGKVITILPGYEAVPAGVQGIIADIPQNMKSVTIDVVHRTVTFEVYPITEDEVTNLQDALIELEERVSALEG